VHDEPVDDPVADSADDDTTSGGSGSMPALDQAFWDERYRSAPTIWSGNPNPQLVAEAADLEPGRALDVGCGEGADAIWLARHGWSVVAADISEVALARAADHAVATDPAAATRIEWRHVDLLAEPPEPDAFDLVTAQFMHLPEALRRRLFRALAAALRPGGTLLVVGHHPSDLATGVRRPSSPGLLYEAAEIADLLDESGGVASREESSWEVIVAESRPRAATTPDGEPVTVHDAVLRARRRTAHAPGPPAQS
jgi:SAM-dependent methyltransferase